MPGTCETNLELRCQFGNSTDVINFRTHCPPVSSTPTADPPIGCFVPPGPRRLKSRCAPGLIHHGPYLDAWRQSKQTVLEPCGTIAGDACQGPATEVFCQHSLLSVVSSASLNNCEEIFVLAAAAVVPSPYKVGDLPFRNGGAHPVMISRHK